MSRDEITTLRRRHAGLEDDADARRGISVNCAPAMAVVTYTKSAYPSAASSVYACHPIAIAGTESEGSSVTSTTDATQTIYALNLGTAIPPTGTKVLATMSGGRWEFVFNG